MDPIAALLDQIRQSEATLYAAGRTLVGTAWEWLQSGEVNGGAWLSNPAGDDTPLGQLWPMLAGPLAAGAVDELRERIQASVAPTIKRAAVAAAAGGFGLGLTVSRLLGRGR